LAKLVAKIPFTSTVALHGLAYVHNDKANRKKNYLLLHHIEAIAGKDTAYVLGSFVTNFPTVKQTYTSKSFINAGPQERQHNGSQKRPRIYRKRSCGNGEKLFKLLQFSFFCWKFI